jgi:hypothetical protein
VAGSLKKLTGPKSEPKSLFLRFKTFASMAPDNGKHWLPAMEKQLAFPSALEVSPGPGLGDRFMGADSGGKGKYIQAATNGR